MLVIIEDKFIFNFFFYREVYETNLQSQLQLFICYILGYNNSMIQTYPVGTILIIKIIYL